MTTCIGSASGTTITRVGFDNTSGFGHTALEPGDNNTITECWAEMGWFIFATARFRFVVASNNRIDTGLIEMDDPDTWTVTGNTIGSGQIVGGAGIRTVIANNTIDLASDDTRGIVFGFVGTAEHCIISNNICWRVGGAE